MTFLARVLNMVNGRSHHWEGLLDSARFGRHIRPMRPILAAPPSALALLFAGAGGTHAQQLRPADTERYVNSTRTMQARFVQTNPNGSVVQGTLYVRRPGRMRFEYDAPSQLKVVADGTQV